MTKIWITDDHAVIRQGLKQILLDEETHFTITAEAATIEELFELLQTQEHPQALILDLSMPGRGGLAALADIKARAPQLPILILSIHPEDQYAIRCLKSGASGYLSKECAPEQLVMALQTVISGQKYITPKVAALLAQQLNSTSSNSTPHELLSDREFEILILITEGVSLTEIGEKLFLSVKTVSTYRTRILKKMNMKNNAELIQYSLKNRLAIQA